MTEAPVLRMPNFEEPFVLEVDASEEVKIDHESLKYLLEQKIVTPMQQKGMLKLLGFTYTIMHRKGKENVATDALSRQGWDIGQSSAITVVTPAWVTELEECYKGDPTYESI